MREDAALPEPEVPATPARPTGRGVVLVFLGGSLGILCRLMVTIRFPSRLEDLALGTLTVNLLGSFLLGWLVAALMRSDAAPEKRARTRLLLGTGLPGGFTTYSTLTLDVLEWFEAGQGAYAVGYALGSVVLGVCAAFLGILLGSLTRRGKAA